jgi:hypothetical protein
MDFPSLEKERFNYPNIYWVVGPDCQGAGDAILSKLVEILEMCPGSMIPATSAFEKFQEGMLGAAGAGMDVGFPDQRLYVCWIVFGYGDAMYGLIVALSNKFPPTLRFFRLLPFLRLFLYPPT